MIQAEIRLIGIDGKVIQWQHLVLSSPAVQLLMPVPSPSPVATVEIAFSGIEPDPDLAGQLEEALGKLAAVREAVCDGEPREWDET